MSINASKRILFQEKFMSRLVRQCTIVGYGDSKRFIMNSQSVLSEHRQESEEKLLKILQKINFDKNYYQYYEKCSNRSEKSNLKLDAFESVLMSSSLDFKYDKREKFFGHKTTVARYDVVFNIAFPYSCVELILSIKVDKSCKIGGPFPTLARKVARLSDPNFSYSPYSPVLPFSNHIELRDTVKFGISLFEEVKQSILLEDPF
jgi:uncharacterized beta-barrel protein YwiB (DUF1934 family)